MTHISLIVGDGDGWSIEDVIKDDDYIADQYDVCKKVIKSGKKLMIGSYSNESGEPVEEFLYDEGIEQGKPHGFTVVYQD